MEFFKNFFPPLKMPRIKKINKESLVNFRERANCKRISNTLLSTMENLHFRINRNHTEPSTHISTISSLKLDSVASKRNPQSENYGLYALKCDRSRASQRGIILHIPTKGGSGSGKKTPDPKEMIHEKFEPCRRSIESLDVPESAEILQRNVTATAEKMKKWPSSGGENAHRIVVAPPRRKRQVKGFRGGKVSQCKIMTSSLSIPPEEEKGTKDALEADIRSTLHDKKPNLMGDRLKKLDRVHSREESIDIFHMSHTGAFDEFDSIFDSISMKVDEKLENTANCHIKHTPVKDDANKVDLKRDVALVNGDLSENVKSKEQQKKLDTAERYSVPKIEVEQWQMSNYVPECKITKSISVERTPRIERIQFQNDFTPNSFSVKHSTNTSDCPISAPSNSIDYHIIKSSGRKITLPPVTEVKSDGNFKYSSDKNNQIWTI